jgi:hypothetical protein
MLSFRKGVVVQSRVARWFIFRPKIPIWVNLGGIGMENVGMFCDHLEHFTTIWYSLWPFGIICGNLDYFSLFIFLDKEKSGNPG